ncbi:MAG: hypothetical protein ACRDY1_08095, partial [Acidimicrobiales bacterium]
MSGFIAFVVGTWRRFQPTTMGVQHMRYRFFGATFCLALALALTLATTGGVSTAAVAPGTTATGMTATGMTATGTTATAMTASATTASATPLSATPATATSPATVTSKVSPSSIPFGASTLETATVTGNVVYGSPTGYVSFAVCGPTAGPAPCTAPTIGPVAVGLSPETGNRSVARVSVEPGAPGWYCFDDTYSGDSHYRVATDNATNECFDVTATA